MRFIIAASLGLGLIRGVFGQPVPMVPISGQPFSADQVVNRVPAPNVRNELTLQTTHVYRDSLGRTRIDVPIPTSPAYSPLVNIYDPVAGVNYGLDTKNKVARRFAIPGFKPGPAIPAQGSSASVPIMTFCKFPPCTLPTSESLGTEFINGLAAEGQRITSVYRVSESSADQQRTVVERWYSPELNLILLEKESGPLGDSTTRIENLNRAEPDPLLFQVPSDYLVVDAYSKTPATSK
jgi:hypothetical protein